MTKGITKEKREQFKKDIYKTMASFNLLDSFDTMLTKCKWYSLACGVKDVDLTKELMKEIIREGGAH